MKKYTFRKSTYYINIYVYRKFEINIQDCENEARRMVKNKTNKTTINSINYDVAYESSLSIENHEGILVTHSTLPS